ncbi:SDR family oxidoreductase [Nocardia jejuensis]|uniref:SDR family oxidoreductase n=1 Tax=Nocardia jejuensis TaxID=328049 RepID=UPI00082EB5E9|nr:SDR family oxidoreductase [Nocardia jejuensis]
MNEQVALVTGSSRGIGRAIAERLATQVAAVVVNYHSNADDAAQVVKTIQAAGADAVAVRADIGDVAQVRGLFDSAHEHFGGLDIIVHNAATASFGPLAEATDDDFDLIFTANARATFLVLREAATRVREAGRIVFVSSGVTATHRPGTGLYAAGKAAGEQLVRVLARELGSRAITVNSVLPGATRTEALATSGDPTMIEQVAALTPLGRIGEPADLADIVGFLVSHDARWVTGQSLHAGGGLF